MQSQQEIEKVLEAAYKVDPDFEDDEMELIRYTLRWVLEIDDENASQFIENHIDEGLA